MEPSEAVLAVTYRCNARCCMCNIWKEQESAEISPIHYLKLPSSLRTINVTGGEPFLRNDLPDIIRVIHSLVPRARIVFSSNGFLTNRIVEMLGEIRRIHSRLGVGVSIDGNKTTHDRIRGVEGAYDRAVSTIRTLKKHGFIDLRIGMTLMNTNVDEVLDVYHLSRELGVEFTMTFAHNSEIYFKKTDNAVHSFSDATPSTRLMESLLASHLRSMSAKDWFRAYHLSGIFDSELRSGFLGNCEAARRFVFIAPNGDVYPCSVLNRKLGNLIDVERWGQLMTPEVSRGAREAVLACTEDCWMVCNTRSLVLAHPMKVSSWILRSKLKAHLRMRPFNGEK